LCTLCTNVEWIEVAHPSSIKLKRVSYEIGRDTYRIKIVDSNIKLGDWFRVERLKKAAGFKFVPEPVLMRNSKGGPLFFLFFATYNEAGNTIVSDIFNKYRKYL